MTARYCPSSTIAALTFPQRVFAASTKPAPAAAARSTALKNRASAEPTPASPRCSPSAACRSQQRRQHDVSARAFGKGEGGGGRAEHAAYSLRMPLTLRGDRVPALCRWKRSAARLAFFRSHRPSPGTHRPPQRLCMDLLCPSALRDGGHLAALADARRVPFPLRRLGAAAGSRRLPRQRCQMESQRRENGPCGVESGSRGRTIPLCRQPSQVCRLEIPRWIDASRSSRHAPRTIKAAACAPQGLFPVLALRRRRIRCPRHESHRPEASPAAASARAEGS